MLAFFRDGGWSMFVIVAFGLVTLAVSAFFAARPDGQVEGFLEWMARAVLWSTLAGLASDIGATCRYVSGVQDPGERGRLTAEGLAESMSPAVMGFVVLAVVSFLAAVGRRRMDARRE